MEVSLITTSLRALGQALLGDLEAISEEVLRSAQSLPGYDQASLDDLRPANRAVICIAIDAVFVHPRSPSPEIEWPDIEWMESAGEERMRQGIPLDAIMQGIEIAHRVVWQTAVRKAPGCDVSADVLLERAGVMIEWTNAIMSRAAIGYRRAEEVARRAQRRRREALVHGALLGTMAPDIVRYRLGVLGLSNVDQFVALRVRTSEADSHGVERTLLTQGALVSSIGGDLAAVCRDRPVLDGVVAGLGSPADPSELPASFESATAALEAAAAFDMVGVFSADDLGVRLAVFAEDRLGRQLADRLLGPLDEEKDYADQLEETIRVFLDEGLRVDPTATRLYVHPNTVRYRLDRYEALAGVSLRSVDDLVRVWWALQRRTLDMKAAGVTRSSQ